ncbi:interferon gamma receptor 1 [Heteronotia binoei]|uniref:interferon gamma receptor 1 n=1 Tax=Heteronotia binoei TaxID=13085 RepID=UPI00292E12D5|nr:interferon gamma receptor 1 [Heteronotia binoei]
MGVARPFAALALLALACCGRPGTEEPQIEVLLPTNVEIKTYNFKTSLHWDYQNMSSEPLFTVQILCYGSTYTEVSSCVNISQHYCDLSQKINKKCHQLWARVKVLVGSHESEYKKSNAFRPFRDARIGPPKFNLSVVDDEIIVVIEHPLTPYHERYPLSVKENLTDFSYKVFLWNQASPQKDDPIEPEECDMYGCVAYLQAPLGFTYCVSVQGISEAYSLSGEESKASCISLSSRYPLGIIGAVIGGVVFFVAALVILAILLVRVWARQRNIPLPKSLVSIVRNIKPVNSFETKTDGKYATISSLSYKPVCEDGKSMEPIDHLTEAETSDLENSGKIVIESQTIQEARAEESCESEQIHEASDTYFKSTSGQEEMCNSLPNGDVPKVDVHQPTDLEACRKLSGYDKPHWIRSESPVA